MIPQKPVLIVDDEVEMRIALSKALKRYGYACEVSHNAIDAFKKVESNEYSLVITDMTMPKRSGINLLKDIKKAKPNIPVILITAYGTIDTAISAFKEGVFDFIQKPFDFDTLMFVAQRALSYEAEQVKAIGQASTTTAPTVAKKGAIKQHKREYRDIITQDLTMLEVIKTAKSVAKARSTVLIQAESGTGKELLAHLVHLASDRAQGPFVAVNCAALPQNLLESELFGHAKGSFTGAISEHKGKFEQAMGGTILLDEVSEMPLALQAKLLRVLQEMVVDRVGSSTSIPIDVRVIATTNRDLLSYVDEGNFREDLYYRLNVLPLNLPPLRDRKGDLPLLVDHFLKKHAELNNKEKVPPITKAALALLEKYHWRGNIRELENVIERAVLLADKEVTPQNLLIQPNKKEKEVVSDNSIIIPVGLSLAEIEKQVIQKTLAHTNDNKNEAADILKVSVRTLRNKLKEYSEEESKEKSS